MEEDGNQGEDQHERSIELPCNFLWYSTHSDCRPQGLFSSHFPGLAWRPPPLRPDMPFAIHLGEVDHLDRDHGLQKPERGEERAEQMQHYAETLEDRA